MYREYKTMANEHTLKRLSKFLEEYNIPMAFFDVISVVEKGAEKHGKDAWLEDGPKTSEKEMHESMFRHLAKSLTSEGALSLRYDVETDLDHLLHLATRALMLYCIRNKKEMERQVELSETTFDRLMKDESFKREFESDE